MQKHIRVHYINYKVLITKLRPMVLCDKCPPNNPLCWDEQWWHSILPSWSYPTETQFTIKNTPSTMVNNVKHLNQGHQIVNLCHLGDKCKPDFSKVIHPILVLEYNAIMPWSLVEEVGRRPGVVHLKTPVHNRLILDFNVSGFNDLTISLIVQCLMPTYYAEENTPHHVVTVL